MVGPKPTIEPNWSGHATRYLISLIKEGTRFRVVAEQEVSVLVHWMAPLTSGFRCVPAIGTVLVAIHDQVKSASAFYCRPLDYTGFEEAHVPPEDRQSPKYDGYSVAVEASQVGRSLELIR